MVLDFLDETSYLVQIMTSIVALIFFLSLSHCIAYFSQKNVEWQWWYGKYSYLIPDFDGNASDIQYRVVFFWWIYFIVFRKYSVPNVTKSSCHGCVLKFIITFVDFWMVNNPHFPGMKVMSYYSYYCIIDLIHQYFI